MLKLRHLAAFTASLYFVQNVALLHATETNLWETRRQSLAAMRPAEMLPPMSVHAPRPFSSFANVTDESHSAISAKTIYLVQDAHLLLEAQTNIAGLITALADELKSKNEKLLVGLEGASSDSIDFSRYSAYPHRKIINETARGLLKANLINGVECAAIGYRGQQEGPVELPFIVTGVENETQYQADIQTLKDSARVKAKAAAELTELKQKIASDKQNFYSPALLQFDSKQSAYQAGRLGVPAYAGYLNSIVAATGAQSKKLIEAVRLEKQIDFSKANAQKMELAGQISRNHTVDFKKYPQVKLYLDYVRLADSINSAALIKEMASWESRAQSTLAKTPAQSDTLAAQNNFYLLKKLVAHTLTEDEWNEYRVLPSGKFAPATLSPFENFYRLALARNETMANRFAEKLSKSNATTGVLVAGGFHTNGLRELLKQKRFTVLTVSPKITKIEENAPSTVDMLAENRLPLDQLFVGDRLFIPLPAVTANPATAKIISDVAIAAAEAHATHAPATEGAATATPPVASDAATTEGKIIEIPSDEKGSIEKINLAVQPAHNDAAPDDAFSHAWPLTWLPLSTSALEVDHQQFEEFRKFAGEILTMLQKHRKNKNLLTDIKEFFQAELPGRFANIKIYESFNAKVDLITRKIDLLIEDAHATEGVTTATPVASDAAPAQGKILEIPSDENGSSERIILEVQPERAMTRKFQNRRSGKVNLLAVRVLVGISGVVLITMGAIQNDFELIMWGVCCLSIILYVIVRTWALHGTALTESAAWNGSPKKWEDREDLEFGFLKYVTFMKKTMNDSKYLFNPNNLRDLLEKFEIQNKEMFGALEGDPYYVEQIDLIRERLDTRIKEADLNKFTKKGPAAMFLHIFCVFVAIACANVWGGGNTDIPIMISVESLLESLLSIIFKLQNDQKLKKLSSDGPTNTMLVAIFALIPALMGAEGAPGMIGFLTIGIVGALLILKMAGDGSVPGNDAARARVQEALNVFLNGETEKYSDAATTVYKLSHLLTKDQIKWLIFIIHGVETDAPVRDMLILSLNDPSIEIPRGSLLLFSLYLTKSFITPENRYWMALILRRHKDLLDEHLLRILAESLFKIDQKETTTRNTLVSVIPDDIRFSVALEKARKLDGSSDKVPGWIVSLFMQRQGAKTFDLVETADPNKQSRLLINPESGWTQIEGAIDVPVLAVRTAITKAFQKSIGLKIDIKENPNLEYSLKETVTQDGVVLEVRNDTHLGMLNLWFAGDRVKKIIAKAKNSESTIPPSGLTTAMWFAPFALVTIGVATALAGNVNGNVAGLTLEDILIIGAVILVLLSLATRLHRHLNTLAQRSARGLPRSVDHDLQFHFEKFSRDVLKLAEKKYSHDPEDLINILNRYESLWETYFSDLNYHFGSTLLFNETEEELNHRIAEANGGPAMRWSGKELTPEQHKIVDQAIREFFNKKRDLKKLLSFDDPDFIMLDPDFIFENNNIRIYVMPGLMHRIKELSLSKGVEFPSDLLTHPGRRERSLYLDPVQVSYIKIMPQRWIEDWSMHEFGHIAIDRKLSETQIQEEFPLPSWNLSVEMSKRVAKAKVDKNSNLWNFLEEMFFDYYPSEEINTFIKNEALLRAVTINDALNGGLKYFRSAPYWKGIRGARYYLLSIEEIFAAKGWRFKDTLMLTRNSSLRELKQSLKPLLIDELMSKIDAMNISTVGELLDRLEEIKFANNRNRHQLEYGRLFFFLKWLELIPNFEFSADSGGPAEPSSPSYLNNNPAFILLKTMGREGLKAMMKADIDLVDDYSLPALIYKDGPLVEGLAEALNELVKLVEWTDEAVMATAEKILPAFVALNLGMLFANFADLETNHELAADSHYPDTFSAVREALPNTPLDLHILTKKYTEDDAGKIINLNSEPDDMIFAQPDGKIIATDDALRKIHQIEEPLAGEAAREIGVKLNANEKYIHVRQKILVKEAGRTFNELGPTGVQHRDSEKVGLAPNEAREKTGKELLPVLPLTPASKVGALAVAAGPTAASRFAELPTGTGLASPQEIREREMSALGNLNDARQVLKPILDEKISGPNARVILNHKESLEVTLVGENLLVDGIRGVESLHQFKAGEDPAAVIATPKKLSMPWQEKAAIYADAQVGHEDTLSAFYQEHSMVDFIEEAVKRSAQSKNEYGLGWFGTKKDFEAKLEEYAEFLKRLPDETISVSKVDLLDKLKIVQNDLASNRLMLFTAELPKDNGGEIDISRALWAMQLQYQAAFQHKPGRIVAISDSKSLILKTTAEIENVVTILYNFVTIQPINGIYQAIILASKQA